MKKHVIASGISALLLVTALAQPSLAQPAKEKHAERIGIYDSRAIAVAYAGSAFQQKKMQDLMNRFQKARESGDTKEVARLEAEGKAQQAELHRQGFGTAPVDNLLAHINSDLPRIQEAAGVTRLISKWNKPELAKHRKAEPIDVTMQLVDAFRPNEKQRRHALEIQKQSPVKVKE